MNNTSSPRQVALPIDPVMAAVRPTLHALMAQITQNVGHKQNHRVMFVSPEHGDGTSTLATTTALTLVRQLRREVTLVEANIYTPAIASYLDLPPAPGLLEFADGIADAESVVRSSRVGGLRVLTAGDCRQPEQGELGSDELRRLISQVAVQQQFTVIDAPPLLEHPEACLLLDDVDEVLLVVRAGSTHEDAAREAVTVLEEAGVSARGVFLNRFTPDLPFGMKAGR